MRSDLRISIVFFIGCLLISCSGEVTDREGQPLRIGETYILTEEGLELVPPLTDTAGNPLEKGKQYVVTEHGLEYVPYIKDTAGNPLKKDKQYVMTEHGLEYVPYMKDKEGNRLDLGSEYLMTKEGLQITVRRNIRGTVQDSSGNPLSGIRASITDSEYKAVTEKNGFFVLPFVEGYVRLAFDVPNIPEWCDELQVVENLSLSMKKHREGWDAGTVTLPCVFLGPHNGRTRWTTTDGNYVDNGDGTVTDVKNKLMWETAAQANDLSWHQAQAYSEDLELGGHSDWRLPTREELTRLYQGKIACGWHYGGGVVRGAMNVWSSETVEPSSARILNVCSGRWRESRSLDVSPGSSVGVLAVRSLGE